MGLGVSLAKSYFIRLTGPTIAFSRLKKRKANTQIWVFVRSLLSVRTRLSECLISGGVEEATGCLTWRDSGLSIALLSLCSTPSITPLLIIPAERQTKGKEKGGADAASPQYAFYKTYRGWLGFGWVRWQVGGEGFGFLLCTQLCLCVLTLIPNQMGTI